jgi:hypothetical protein
MSQQLRRQQSGNSLVLKFILLPLEVGCMQHMFQILLFHFKRNVVKTFSPGVYAHFYLLSELVPVSDIGVVLGFVTMWFHRVMPLFRGNLLPPSSGLK